MPVILGGSLKGFEPHQLSGGELSRRLQVDPAKGLMTEEARRRLVELGPNELTERSARNPWTILWDQLSATMVVVLLAAAAISFALSDAKDAIAILAIVVLNGRATAIVTHTGMQTELGRIAGLLQQVKREATPLQRRLDRFGRFMAVASLAIIGLILVFGLLRGEEVRLMFLTAVSMAVAVVPEGLPAVVTIALALGAQRMLKRHALIRRLPAVESLGSVTVI
jgi:magnesium-transporting ATPase (P-type)